jgi:hypothetical protein
MNALVDTLRQRRIEALARRAAAHQGEARRLLAHKQLQLLQDCSDAQAAPVSAAAPPQASALAGLLADIARRSPSDTGLKTVHEHRSTWAQLHVDQRLHQAQVRLPDNAGPLNTQRLLLQALSLMRDASPQYLQHFMAHAETLLWLEATSPARVQPRKEPSRTRRRAPR